MSLDRLFSPFRLKSLSLMNRVVMAPMTRSFSPGGIAPPEVARYYQRRALADVGLIITEATVIDRPASRNDPDVPSFYGEAGLAAWKRVVDAVHAGGGRIVPQLWHVGASRAPGVHWSPPGEMESPSGLRGPGKPLGKAMTEEDIADTIAAYAQAARAAKDLGFDAVEIHGAHGYLIDSFFWEVLNRREDHYGGADVVARSRFAVEVIRAVREAVGEEFCILFRISQWKPQDYQAKLVHSPAELEAWLGPLADAGVDIFHCSQRRFWEPEFDGSQLNLAGWARKVSGRPSITVGSVGLTGEFIGAYMGESSDPASLDDLLERLDQDEFDLVAVGRALLSDPEWARKVRDGRTAELKAFVPAHRETLY
jgi:2,4-dienoyl-CoA reductase-like NADH-dependent reductase (Old Yellow Enzyme family)